MIQQGHKYDFRGRAVIAVSRLHDVDVWKVRPLNGGDGLWLGEAWLVLPGDLKPLQMKYFGGEAPSAGEA